MYGHHPPKGISANGFIEEIFSPGRFSDDSPLDLSKDVEAVIKTGSLQAESRPGSTVCSLVSSPESKISDWPELSENKPPGSVKRFNWMTKPRLPSLGSRTFVRSTSLASLWGSSQKARRALATSFRNSVPEIQRTATLTEIKLPAAGESRSVPNFVVFLKGHPSMMTEDDDCPGWVSDSGSESSEANA